MRWGLARRFASHVLNGRTMERIVDPIIADVQKEHHEATQRGSYWLSYWVVATGSLGLAKALVLWGIERALLAPFHLASDDRRPLIRTLGWGALFIATTTAVLALIPLQSLPLGVSSRFAAFFLIALLPQALPLAIPIGLTLGIVAALDRPGLSPASRKSILGVAVLCSIVSFATIAWIMPRANQAFRTTVFQALGNDGFPRKGDSEMTIGELRKEIAVATRLGEFRRARWSAVALHHRVSIPCATLLLAAFALSLRGRYPSAGRPKLVAIACGVIAGYYVVAFLGEDFVRRDSLAPIVGVWLPNLLLTSYFLLLTYRSVVEPSH